jgi:hypothetical protein
MATTAGIFFAILFVWYGILPEKSNSSYVPV